jgi:hypothetical protein
MLKPKVLSAALVLMPVVIPLTAYSSAAETTTSECKSGPGSSAPPGQHWYYRVDRANNRHCWYLHSQGAPVRSHANLTSLSPNGEYAPDRSQSVSRAGAVEPTSEQSPAAPISSEALTLDSGVSEESLVAFANRWVDLPKSLDLDRRETIGTATGYATEQATVNAEQDLPPAWSGAPTASATPATGQGESNFGSISMLGAGLLALLLLSEAVIKLLRSVVAISMRLSVRAVSSETAESGATFERAAYPHHGASKPADDPSASMGLKDLRGVLRRVDSGLRPPRSFAPSRSTRKQPAGAAQYFGRWTHIRKHLRTHSAFQRLKTGSLSGPRWAPL